MKLKNIGNKIISIGATVILPGEAKEVTGYDDNEIVKFFIGRGKPVRGQEPHCCEGEISHGRCRQNFQAGCHRVRRAER